MLSYSEALELMLRDACPMSRVTEVVSLAQSLGRTTAQTILSQFAHPPFANAAMDGFAVQAKQTLTASPEHPLRFLVSGCLVAGDATVTASDHGAVEIMTGAPLLDQRWDTVVKVEDVSVERARDGRAIAFVLTTPLAAHENVRFAGEDFAARQEILPAGICLGPEHLALLAAAGVTEVPVVRVPRVALIATGKELVSGAVPELQPGQIVNSTLPFLLGALQQMSASATFLGNSGDDAEEFARMVRQAASYDLILSTGAVSVGCIDFVPEVITAQGFDPCFHRVSIRPGKPILFARGRNKKSLFLALPGNPVATMVGTHFFAQPLVRMLQGLEQRMPYLLPLQHNFTKKPGMTYFLKAQRHQAGVAILPGQQSFKLRPFADADGWVVLDHAKQDFEAGDLVAFYPTR